MKLIRNACRQISHITPIQNLWYYTRGLIKTWLRSPSTYRIKRAAKHAREVGQGLILRDCVNAEERWPQSSYNVLFLSSDQPTINQQQTNDAFYIQHTTSSTFLLYHPFIYISILLHPSLFISPTPFKFLSALCLQISGSLTSPLSPVSSFSPAAFVCCSLVAAMYLGRKWSSSYLRAQQQDWREQTAPWEVAGPVKGRGWQPVRQGSAQGGIGTENMTTWHEVKDSITSHRVYTSGSYSPMERWCQEAWTCLQRSLIGWYSEDMMRVRITSETGGSTAQAAVRMHSKHSVDQFAFLCSMHHTLHAAWHTSRYLPENCGSKVGTEEWGDNGIMRWNDYDDIPTKVYHKLYNQLHSQHWRVIALSNEITIIACLLVQHLDE